MASPPQVSVVIPAFNAEATIRRAIESVLNQTFTDLEVIVVDDCSTDRTAEAIAPLTGDRVRLVKHEHNRGAAAARNTGVSAARGRLIAFLDSDDTWKPHKLARQIEVLGRSANGLKACASGYYLHKGSRELTIKADLTSERFKRDIVFGCTISPGSTLLVERSVFEQVGLFDEDLRRLEDWDWLLRFCERADMIFVAEPLADIYLLSRNKTSGTQRYAGLNEAIDRMRAKHRYRFTARAERMRFQSSLMVERAAMLYRLGNPVGAALNVLAALTVYPARNAAFFRMLWRSVFRGRAATGG